MKPFRVRLALLPATLVAWAMVASTHVIMRGHRREALKYYAAYKDSRVIAHEGTMRRLVVLDTLDDKLYCVSSIKLFFGLWLLRACSCEVSSYSRIEDAMTEYIGLVAKMQ